MNWHHWSSGRIRRCHRRGPCSIHGWCTFLFVFWGFYLDLQHWQLPNRFQVLRGDCRFFFPYVVWWMIECIRRLGACESPMLAWRDGICLNIIIPMFQYLPRSWHKYLVNHVICKGANCLYNLEYNYQVLLIVGWTSTLSLSRLHVVHNFIQNKSSIFHIEYALQLGILLFCIGVWSEKETPEVKTQYGAQFQWGGFNDQWNHLCIAWGKAYHQLHHRLVNQEV